MNINPMFQELKEKLVSYYRESLKPNPQIHKDKSRAWRQILYSSLHRLLTEVVFTPEKRQQEECLERVFTWYYEKVGRPVHNQVVEYPEEVMTVVNTEQSLNPGTEDKLRMYSRRQITSATTRSEGPGSRPATASLTGTRIIPPSIPMPVSRPMTAASRPMTASGVFTVSRPNTVAAPSTGTRRVAWGEGSQGFLTTGAFTGLGDPITEPRATTFSSTYVHYTPLENEEDKKVESRLQAVLTKDQGEERVQSEMREKVFAWSVKRARQEEELTRRTEGNRFASRFESRGLASRPKTALPSLKSVQSVPTIDLSKDPQKPEEQPQAEPLPSDLPYFDNYEKVNRMRRLHGSLIEARDHYAVSDQRLTELNTNTLSLSAFNSSSRPATAQVRATPPGALSRPMSAVSAGLTSLQNFPVSAGRLAQLEEINEVKSRLAKHGVTCAFESLSAALLVPEDLPPAKLNLADLPDSGARLMVNPFIKLGKKKKKKKGKKLKKGKKGKKSR
jgi:hypothetical protein